MSFFVTADGGLTTAGYVGCVVLMVALVVIASVLSAQKSKGNRCKEAGVLCDGDGAGVCDFVCEGV